MGRNHDIITVVWPNFEPAKLVELDSIAPGLAADLLKLFLKNPQETLPKIEQSVEAMDREKIELNAHALKGAAGQLGFIAMS